MRAMDAAQQKALLASLPSRRWRSILLGLCLGLFLSAALTSNFVRSNSLIQGTWLPLTSPNSSISAQLYIFFFRSPKPEYNAPEAELFFSQAVDENLQEFELSPQAHVEGDSRSAAAFPLRSEDKASCPEATTFKKKPRPNYTATSPLHARNHTLARRPGNTTSTTNAGKKAALSDGGSSVGSNPSSALAKGAATMRDFRGSSSESDWGGGGLTSKSSEYRAGRGDPSLGAWVQDDSYPLYGLGSCPFVDEAFNCYHNGRPDSNYTRWKWVPRDCTIPRFNGTDLLERMRGKRLVFVGDSLNRNQWESMLCILWESLQDKTRIAEVHGGRISKLPGAYAFKFLDFNCSVEFYTSHFLVDEEIMGGADEPNKFTVTLDRMDKSERRWRKANVLVFNTGHWWTPDKIGDGDNCFREGGMVHEKLDIMTAYRRAIRTWSRWVETYVNASNTRVFFRGYSPTHYLGGQWNSGGQCHTETQPIFDESFLGAYPDKMRVVEAEVAPTQLVEILNVTRLSDFRKDAHPAIYGHLHVNRKPLDLYQDCSHWCLPGLPDTWNELLYFALFFDNTTTGAP